ncbi:bifunctional [glutamine synthetase] adenylyltransferase/[glutamine synthetase]-adenylyl-L-tyrosine phosphorylase [Nigerium massiliense]|uniref:bifunctional [glutamine synthetase] adenylyltransferase/[glutamine synthetase]-adenylyl-L-tyrosine phosphorylase n=1 Tax=Nigerium massiliense TaxID=1522317 RepID=UPI000590D2B1|nr:bifunctional [glutamine synthetase] adenylyltransferase/[glutamine synthetase]-adenylyl-L-tyrosine phosphorylase [Nigerium massiliense]
MTRMSTPAGRLAARGFAEPQVAVTVIERWMTELDDDQICSGLVEDVLASADPDLALTGLDRIAASPDGRFRRIAADPVWRARVARVLGASAALTMHCGVHGEQLEALAGDIGPRGRDELRAELLAAVGADPDAPAPVATSDPDALRLAYRQALLRTAARDLSAEDPSEEVSVVGAELAALADAVVESALALARAEVPGWEDTRLAIVALGKTGARELNYVSDVDVLYVAEPALDGEGAERISPHRAVAIASKLVGAVSRICSAHSAAGTIWPIDAALRPEGNAGPLVRTLASHEAYYSTWAKNWEFQAMLKARPMAGDLELAQQFVDVVWPHVWQVADNEMFVAEVQAMRKRVISLIPAKDADDEIKLGAGGLRDTEFTVQLLQLVHGRTDERLRLRGTFEGLQALIDHGYVGREDGALLDAAYRFQRVLEHRSQLFQLRRTHLIPRDEASRRRIARSMGLKDAATLMDQWHRSKRRVLRLHQRLFYSPLLEAVARIPSQAVRLTSDAAETRLRALGYAGSKDALRHLAALTQGVTRQAEIQRQLLPAMLGWFAEGPNPDHGLLAFRQLSEALGHSSWYLRALRDEGAMAENLARVLASSRYATDLLRRAPQTVEMLADIDQLKPRPLEDITAEMRSTASRHDDEDDAAGAIRAVRRRELLRLAMGDLLGVLELDDLGTALTDVTTATIDATLDVAGRDVEGVPRLAVVAMGRWGGRELSYGSDADALVVIEDGEDADRTKAALAVVGTLRRLLAKPGADPALEVDLDLRPEGKQGPMVRTLASYRAYYERWSSTWERQALLRAGLGAGDRELAGEFLTLIEPVRHPRDGLSGKEVVEIRRLKARMEAERLPRGVAPQRHVKLGPGGLSDVEWTVQLLQLEHAGRVEALRTTRTTAALDVLFQTDLINEADAHALRRSWEEAARIRNAATLQRGKASDVIPSDVRELVPLTELLGYAKGQTSVFMEDHSRAARQARRVMDRLFWGQ